MLSPVRVRSSRWVLEPLLVAFPLWASVLVIGFALLILMGPVTILFALLIALMLAVLFFEGARRPRGKLL